MKAFSICAKIAIVLLLLGVCTERLCASGNGGGTPAPEAIAERFFTGAASGDLFGYAVAGAGDVNGDGFGDVIVGAFQNDAVGSNGGRAYVYFGGLTVNTVADIVLNAEWPGDNFGVSVAGGDVNGDGFSDIIVGAKNYDSGGNDAGRAYIYFGGAIVNTTADILLTGAAGGDFFGTSVSAAGDVNGDGYCDVIVGANFNDAGGSNAGRAYVYFGGSAMDNTEDVTFTGTETSESFGCSVSGAGDVNGDGFSDVIVGSYLNNVGGTDAGRAFVYFGGSGMNNSADIILTGTNTGDAFGISVSGAGDVNGDGYSDVIVGSYQNDAGGTTAGRAYVYFGGAIANAVSDVILTGTASFDQFGYAVDGAGDVNGDGYDDVIVGAYTNDAGGAEAGRAYVYFGGASMDAISDVLFTGAASDDNFGVSVACAGDVNNDGYSDILVGAIGNDAGGAAAGRAYLYLNSLTGADIADEFIIGAAVNDILGLSVSNAGDVNGDGYTDIIVGASGRAEIHFGGTSMNNIADVTLTSPAPPEDFGRFISDAGDVNGDGYSDVIVGATNNSAGGLYAGRAYIYFGGASMNNSADVILTGAAPSDHFGIVSGAGDVNGDGYSDVIVGAEGHAVSDGRAYIYFGGTTMNNVADVTFTGAATERLGSSVSSAGDVNGDGFGDVIVGAPTNDAGGTDAGRSYVYFGGTSMNNSADVILTGAAPSDYFGIVSGAGDVNGDGYGDVIVGSVGNDAGGGTAGQAYIYFGGTTMNNVADVTFTGDEARDNLGSSVSGAGDVNGDGYGDVIVGADRTEPAVFDPDIGRAYVYFGSASMNNVADIIVNGASIEDYFGASVSGAGDVNGDGYSDVIVGALADDAGGGNAGRAYLYLSSSPPIVPRVSFVRDVPNDQGGRVSVRWIRSGYDVQGISKVTQYVVERSNPPGVNGFAWNHVATVTANHNPQYSIEASMPNDSGSGNSGTQFFRITASTANVNEYWRSNIMSGHSTDNLAPSAIPAPIIGPQSGGVIRISWSPSAAPDMFQYRVFRSTVSGFTPGDSTLLATTTDTTFTDSSFSEAIFYYRVAAEDIHGNIGDASPEASGAASTFLVSGGWNLISVPLTVEDYTKDILFPASQSQAFAYDGTYEAYSVLQNRRGFWLKFPSAQNVSMTGSPRAEDTIAVSVGWNLIGSISSPVPVSSIGSIPGGIVTSAFYGYGPSGYVVSNSIESGKGYWVKASQNGNLILSSTIPDVTQRIRIVPTNERPPSPPDAEISNPTSRIPTEFTLDQNFPNPFNPSTTIRYGLPTDSRVSLKVYNLVGEEVATLAQGIQSTGFKTVEWNALNIPSGTYFIRLQAGEYTAVQKILLLK